MSRELGVFFLDNKPINANRFGSGSAWYAVPTKRTRGETGGETLHPYPAHTAETLPTQTHTHAHTYLSNKRHTHPNLWANIAQRRSTAYLDTERHTHTHARTVVGLRFAGQRFSPPSFHVRSSLFFFSACLCAFRHFQCAHSCRFMKVILCVCVCVRVHVCECGCGQAQSSSRQLRGNPHQLPCTTL